ncbi:hypothetical protein Acr_06g0007500 [Actinidia rufa]|uniref:Uncharacterized protein n=1 Tax=Actinidia rufa TaxID=165716 RepID=A0A7J0ER89_9ERIC|nr:hypothetical protein Acr_06g0007500 [Actinidia rufa]
MEEEGGGGASLIRDLASCNKATRDRALKRVLNTWLPSQIDQQIPDDDMKKMWKGLFYCVWHADKAPIQADLIDRLSSLLLSLPLPLSLHYLSAFFLTIRREWPGIDSLRLDKFYLLIRRFLHSSFLMLNKTYSWDVEISTRFMDLLGEKTFFADDNLLGNGVNYHVASIFLEELRFFLPLRSEILDVIFRQFLCVLSKSQDKVLLGKVKSQMFDVLLKMGRNLLELKKLGENMPSPADSEDDKNVVVLGTIALTMSFSSKFYELGTSSVCLQANRKVLFSLHEDFLRLEKDLASSGIEVTVGGDVMVDNEDEIPKLIPIATDTEEGTTAFEVVLEQTEVVKESESKKKKNKASDKSNNGKAKVLDGANKNKSLKKKKKKHKIPKQCSTSADKENAFIANGDISSNGMTATDETNLIFNKSVISNLQMQFEKVAAEVVLDKDGLGSYDSPEITVRTAVSKKRKRARNADGRDTSNLGKPGAEDGKNIEKSAKRVRFSMKNNLVWKPHSPLPPQNLRLPPSVTPRGSALKKGIPPGPIREMPLVTRKMKQKKKGRKGAKAISPAIKRLRKLQTRSV